MSHVSKLLRLTFCLFAATLALPVAAATSNVTVSNGTEGEPVIHTHLTASHSTATAGQTLQLAWQFNLAPNWHVYFSNAGDSGLPPELSFNSQPLPLTFPTPAVISVPPITNYGYYNSVTFTTSLTLPQNLPQGLQTVSLKGSFLYCHEVCMPATIQLELPITIAATSTANPSFAPTQSMPAALPQPVSAQLEGTTITLTLPATAQTAHFIPLAEGTIHDSADQPLKNNQLTLQLDDQNPTKPTQLKGILLLNGSGYVVDVPITPAPTANTTSGLTSALFFAFLAGLILNLMPCVLPVLSLKVLSLVKHHHGPSRQTHTLAYTLGVLSSFWAFALAIHFVQQGGNTLGWGFHLQNTTFIAGLALLMLTLALNFFGIFALGQSLTRFGSTGKTENPLSTFITGILAVVVATPCTVPFMGGAMAYALTQPLPASLAVFTTLGLGMAAPFLLVTTFPHLLKSLPKPGQWMSTFKHALGWPMLATALWLTYVFANQTSTIATFALLALMLLFSLTLWLYGTFPRRLTALLVMLVAACGLLTLHTRLAEPSAPTTWQPWSPVAQQQALQSGQPVFVDFTADWCLTCKVVEATVLNTAKVQVLFKQHNTILLQADWTRQNPEITTELEKHGRKGVPLYLLYQPGNPTPTILPQILTPATIKAALQP